MSVTVNDVLLGAYYRRGENSVPNDSNVKARGIVFVGEAFREFLRQNLYWFATRTLAYSTTDGKDIYPLDDDFRQMIEVRLNGNLVFPESLRTASNVYRYPPVTSPYPIDYLSNNWYFIDGTNLTLIPKSSETPSDITVSSFTVSGTTCTVVTASAHGLATDDYTLIAGAVQDELNGSKQVTRVSDTSFTYTVASGTTSELSPTATSTHQNLTMRHYYWGTTTFTALTDVVAIPDRYIDGLSAFVYGRLAQMEGERGDAADGFKEFNEVVKQANMENMDKQVVQSSSSGVGY